MCVCLLPSFDPTWFPLAITTLHLIHCLTSLAQHVHVFLLFLTANHDWTLDLVDRLSALSVQIITLASEGRIGQPEEGLGLFQVVHVGRWDGITAQSWDPLGTVGCEAHMGNQAADELLIWASHRGLRERCLHQRIWSGCMLWVCIVWVGTGYWIQAA